jgi:hypothetical protein
VGDEGLDMLAANVLDLGGHPPIDQESDELSDEIP